MKRTLLLALLISSSLLATAFARQVFTQQKEAEHKSAQTAQTKAADAQAAAPKLSAEQIDEILDRGEKAFVLDVRRPEEAAQIGTLKGAVNIPLAELETRLKEVPKNKAILTLSNHAARAAKAAALLEKNGFKIVGAVGVQDYVEGGGRKHLNEGKKATD